MIFDNVNEEDMEDLTYHEEKSEEKTEEKPFISDSSNAVGIISTVLSKNPKKELDKVDEIKQYICRIFSLFSDVAINQETELYSYFMSVADKLKEVRRYTMLEGKIIIGIGGHFSAGKSKFIKSITGIEDLLPEAQSPSTSIPTYIIKGDSDERIGINIFGSSAKLSEKQVKAISHEFHTRYKVGFSAFLENLILTSHKWELPEKIALIDTPGIAKPDDKQNQSLSDTQKAINQLNVANYIIWLIDIDNGVLKNEDIEFLRNLDPENPILIVVNKADKKNKSEITEILDVVEKTVNDRNISCYGISAYSSDKKKEYDKRIIYGNECKGRLIDNFIKDCSASTGSDSIMEEFELLEDIFISEIDNFTAFADKDKIINMINSSVNVMDIMSLALILRDVNSESLMREYLKEICKAMFKELNKKIKNILKEENK